MGGRFRLWTFFVVIRVGGECGFGRLGSDYGRFGGGIGRLGRIFGRFDVCMIVGYLKETMPWQSLFFQPI
jgi:hypothetical protein